MFVCGIFETSIRNPNALGFVEISLIRAIPTQSRSKESKETCSKHSPQIPKHVLPIRQACSERNLMIVRRIAEHMFEHVCMCVLQAKVRVLYVESFVISSRMSTERELNLFPIPVCFDPVHTLPRTTQSHTQTCVGWNHRPGS